MSYLWRVRFIGLMLLQMVSSFTLIYKGKKKISYFTEIVLTVTSIIYAYYIVPKLVQTTNLSIVKSVYNNYSFTVDKLLWYGIEYIIIKLLLITLIWGLKYFSFYALKSVVQKNGRIAKIGYKLFGKKEFIRFVSKMWDVDYGIKIKKGIPSRCNKRHKESGVYFDKDGFPKFKSIVTFQLDRKLYKQSREVHFTECNKMLYEKIRKNKKFAEKFENDEVESFKKNIVPDKYTWHHHQEPGKMQLVNREIHKKVYHVGGFSIWGKKEK